MGMRLVMPLPHLMDPIQTDRPSPHLLAFPEQAALHDLDHDSGTPTLRHRCLHDKLQHLAIACRKGPQKVIGAREKYMRIPLMWVDCAITLYAMSGRVEGLCKSTGNLFKTSATGCTLL
jgi:hypothetical protein